MEDKIDVKQSIGVDVVKTTPAVTTGRIQSAVPNVSATPKTEPMKRVTVLYHRNCTDGWCSAYLLKKVFKNAVLIDVNYGENPPEIIDTDLLIIADFSYPKDALLDLKSKVKEIVVLDHHKTAKDQLEGLDFCTFDMNESGASLVAAYLKKLYPTYTSPWFVDYVKDRDLWTWTLPESRAINAFIRTFEMSEEDWDKLIAVNASIASKSGQAILAAQKQVIDGVLKNAIKVKYEGHDAVVVNSSCYQSEIGEAACETGAAFAVVFSIRSDKKVSVSFRSKGYNVAREALRYGGGGHVQAAGCVFDRYEDFVREIIRE